MTITDKQHTVLMEVLLFYLGLLGADWWLQHKRSLQSFGCLAPGGSVPLVLDQKYLVLLLL